MINRSFFEFKYLLPPSMLSLVEKEVQRFLARDKYAGKKGFYIVNSLYFDSADLRCYWAKFDGLYNRKKYRLRFYNNQNKLFFEIKRKRGDLFFKQRSLLHQPSDKKFFLPFQSKSLLNRLNSSSFRTEVIHDFYKFQLKANIWLRFKRRAYQDPFNRFRITLDSHIQYGQENKGKMPYWKGIKQDFIILEVKFQTIMPALLYYLLGKYNLERIAFSKYAFVIEQIGMNRYN